jgi:RHS repeat-associated protein
MAATRLTLHRAVGLLLVACAACLASPIAHAAWTARPEPGLSATPLAGEPQAIALSNSARLVAVALRGAKTVAFLNIDSGDLLGQVALERRPIALAFNAAGTRAYVLSEDSNRLAVIDAGTRILVATWAVGAEPVALAFDSARSELVVADAKGKRLRALDPATGSELRNLALDFAPRQLVLSIDGQRLVIGGKGLLVSLNATSWNEIARTTVGDDIRSLAWWDFGALALAVSKKQDALNLIDTETGTIAERIALDGDPDSMAVSHSEDRAFVSTREDLSVNRVELAPRSLSGRYPLPGRAGGVAFDPDTRTLLITQPNDDMLLKLDPAQASLIAALTLNKRLRDIAIHEVTRQDQRTYQAVALADKSDQLLRIELGDRSVQTVTLPATPQRVQVDTGLNVVVVSLRKAKEEIGFVDLSRAPPTVYSERIDFADEVRAIAVDSTRALTVALTKGTQRIHLVDNASRTVVASLPSSEKLQALAIHPARGTAYLVAEDKKLLLLDLASRTVTQVLSLTFRVDAIAVDAALDRAVLTTAQGDRAYVLDLATLAFVADFALPRNPGEVAIQPETHMAVVTSRESDAVSVIDLQSLRATSGFSTLDKPNRLALSARYNQAWVLSAERDEIAVVQLVNPKPVLSLVVPSQVPTGTPAMALMLHGVGFIDGAVAYFGTSAITTRWQSHELLFADVPASLLAAAASVSITVVNAGPGGGTSNVLTFRVDPPMLRSIAPAFLLATGTAQDITVTGANFVPGARIRIGPRDLITEYLSATQLRATVPGDVLTEPGSLQVSVLSTAEQSNSLTLRIRSAAQDASLVVNPANVRLVQGARAAVSLELSSAGSAPFNGLARLSVSGLPVGVSARFEPPTLSAYQTGTLHLIAAPDAALGNYTVTVHAEVTEAGGARVKTAPLGLSVQAGSGVTGVGGRFVTPDGRGIAGIIVRADTGQATQPQTVTDAAGNFLLTGLPAGALTLRFDATPAHPLYPIWPYNVVLVQGATLAIPDWVIDPSPSDDKFTAISNAVHDQTVTDARFPGVEILLPAGVDIVGWDGVKKTRVAIERREPENLPVPAPPIPTRSVYQLYFGTSSGGIPTAPIPVALPNDLDLDPGQQTELWYYDGSPMGGSGEWKRAGTGTVSADGRSIVSDVGSGIPRFCGVCGLMCFRGVQDAAPNKPCCDSGGEAPPQTAGLQVTLATGQELTSATDLVVDGEVPIVIAREFNPFDAFAFVANYQQSLGINWSFSYDIALLPFQSGLGVVRLVLPGNRRVDLARGADERYRNGAYRGFDGAELTRIGGESLPAVPPVRLSSGASSGTGGLNTSPTCGADGSLYLLRFKDGTQWRFDPSPNATPVKVRDGCLYHLTRVTDPRGRTLTIARDAKGQAHSISTSSGQSVRIEYADEVISAITDNLGRRVTYTHVVVPNTSGSKLGFGGVGTGGSSASINQGPPPIVPRRLVAAVTPEGSYSYGYEDDPEYMRLGGLGPAGGGAGTPTGQSMLLPDHSSDTCQELRGGTRIVSFTRPGLDGSVQLVYGKGKRVLREIWPDGTILNFSYEIAGGCTAQPGVVPLSGERHPRCQGASCPTEDSLANVQAGLHVLGGAVRATTVTDNRGNSSTQRFNGAGLATEIVDASGQKTMYQRDGSNRVTVLTDPLGRTWRYAYDERGNRIREVDPTGRLTETAYDPKWNKPSSTVRRLEDGTAIVWQMRYDPGNGNLVELTDPEGDVTQFGYDSEARLEAIIDPLNHTTRLAYNDRGEVIRITDALGNQVSLERDTVGRIVASVDALGYRSETGYNGLDQVTQIKDALGGLTRLAYDGRNNLQSVTDPLDHVIESYGYDGVGRLTRRTDAKLKSESYRYDAAGNLLEAIDRKGRSTTLTYDEQNRVSRIDHADGTSQKRNYDVVGRLARIEEGNFVEEYDYDALDRVTRVATTANGLPTALTYEYDNLDRLTKRTVNGQEVTEYRYDKASRLTAIVFRRPGQADETTSYSWDAGSRLTQKTLPNGIGQELTYDDANRLTRIRYVRSDESLIEAIDYAYDPNGNRILKSLSTASVPETPFTAAYDEANRMTQITLRPGSPEPKTYVLGYDDNGNLATKQNLNDTADVTIYTWDVRDRLVGIQGPGVSAAFAYDALGRRIERTVNGETTRYVYDGIQAIGEIRGSQTTTLLTSLIIDEMIARYGDQSSRAYLTDALGSVIAQAKADQSILNTYAYSPYGEIRQGADDEGNNSVYTARERDRTGLYFYRARYYDPLLKRFLGEDPVGFGSGANVYTYVDGDPASLSDPTGEFGVPGAIISAGVELAVQLALSGGDLKCVDWWAVGVAGVTGAVGGAYLGGVFRHAASGKSWFDLSRKWDNVRRRYRNVQNVPSTHDAHHWAFARDGTVARSLEKVFSKDTADSIVNHPWNLFARERGLHQDIHNQFGLLRRWLHGTPPWAKAAQGSAGVGLAGEALCGCD